MNQRNLFVRMCLLLSTMCVFALISCVDGPTVIDPIPASEPDHAIPLDASNFDSLVVDSGTIAVVEFYSAHCPVCASMGWVIDSLAVLRDDSALVGAVNTDADDSLWRRYSVSVVPSYLLFRDGVLVTRREYSQLDSSALDTLTALLSLLMHDTLAIDTADTLPPIDTLPHGLVLFDETNFTVLTNVQGRVAMVDFFSPLCGACQAMDGIVDSLSLQFAGRALIGKVNVLEDTTLQRTFAIQWWPTFVFLNGGVETRRVIGVTPRETLAAILDSLLMP